MGHTEEKVSTANTFDMRTLNVEITSCSIASKNCDNYELSGTNDIEYICTKSELDILPEIYSPPPNLTLFLVSWFALTIVHRSRKAATKGLGTS